MATKIEQTPIERAIALLAVHLEPTSTEYIRLEGLVGEARIQEIKSKWSGEEERLRFEFDLLGEDEAGVIEGLLQTTERKTIQEKIAVLQNNLRKGGEAEHGSLLKEISSLKRREQELRQ